MCSQMVYMVPVYNTSGRNLQPNSNPLVNKMYFDALWDLYVYKMDLHAYSDRLVSTLDACSGMSILKESEDLDRNKFVEADMEYMEMVEERNMSPDLALGNMADKMVRLERVLFQSRPPISLLDRLIVMGTTGCN